MNYKLCALLLTLALASTPALQAMRLARAGSQLMTARSLWQSAGRRALTHTPLRYKHTDSISDKRSAKSFPINNNMNALDVYELCADLMSADAEGKEIITTAIAQNIDALINKFIGYQLIDNYYLYHLSDILRASNEQSKTTIINAIARNIGLFGSHDISVILEISDEEHKEIIIDALINNFSGHHHGDKFNEQHLCNILGSSHGQVRTAIIKAIAKSISLFDGHAICNFLEKSDKQHEEIITTAIAKNIGLFDGHTICDFLEISDEQQKKIILISIAQNIDALINKFSGFALSRIILISHEQNQTIIAKAIAKNIDQFDGHGIGHVLGASNEQHKEIITTAIAQNIKSNIHKYEQITLEEILNSSNEQSKEAIIKAMHTRIDEFIGQQVIDSQSSAHFKDNALDAWKYITPVANNPKFKIAFQKALSHEHSVSNDTAIFYHSQKSPLYWLELLYTKLWEQKYKQRVPNYLFTRFPADSDKKSNMELQHDSSKQRTKLLKNGRTKGFDDLRPHLLFANYALFGNATNWGSCSAAYFLDNFNIGDPNITTQTITDKFGDPALFAKYEKELEQLETEFKNIVSNSVLLQFIIPHKSLKDHVYLTRPGGYKKKVKISGEETDDIITIIKTLKAAPKTMDDTDRQEFCFVMTPDAVHTLREQGSEVRVYGGFDQEKLDDFIKRLEAFIARMAQENPQTFSARMAPTQSCYHAFKPVLNDLIERKD